MSESPITFHRAWMFVVLASFACGAGSFAVGQEPGDLYISISETRTEHSRDSGTRVKTIKVNGSALVYETANRKTQLHKEYRLTDEEVRKLRQLISEKQLLTSYAVEYAEPVGPHTSTALSVELKLNRRKSLIRISGPINSEELRNDRVYQNANAFLEAVTELIEARDNSNPP